MQVIVLAAGKGSRMRSGVKTLLRINGETLLNRIIRVFRGNKIIVVVGHKKEEIIDWYGSDVTIVENPAWHSTDNAFSLYCALKKEGVDDSFVINGDTIFDEEIIQNRTWIPDSVGVDFKKVEPEEMQVLIENEKVVKIAKDIGGNGEALLYYFSKETLGRAFVPLAANEKRHFEVIINQIMKPMNYVSINPYHAMEIDNWTDYAEAKKVFE